MTGGEWVGGVRSAPFYVTGDGPQRPDVIVWLEAVSGLVVGLHLDRPGLGPIEVAECLARAIERPQIPVAPPASVRVADSATAEAVRARLGDETRVIVGPTPEVDVVIAEMARSFPKGGGSEVSYLEDGRVSEEAVAWLFRSAAALWRVAPWKLTDDDQVLGLDVPECGLRGGCLTIIGSLGQNFGFVLFESFAAYERFAARPEGQAPDLRGHLLTLSFEPRRQLTPTMRREIAAHAWPVAGARAHPVVMCVDPDGTARPTSELEVRLAAACAEAVTEFALRHRNALASGAPAPIRERIRVPRAAPVITVLLAAPHPLLAIEASEPPVLPIIPRAGRNDPCPCGSGKKYKRCHLAFAEAQPQGPAADAASLLALDARLVAEMKRFGEVHHGAALRAAAEDWERGDDSVPHEELLLVPWLLFHRPLEGRPLVDHFLGRRGTSLSGRERSWLEAQSAARLSAWQVLEVDPGSSLTVEDLFTGERREVRETTASRIAVPRDRILARVVVHGDVALFAGVHPRALAPSAAARVIAAVKRALGTRAAWVPAERLRDETIALRLAHEWDRAVAAAEARFQKLRLTNTDGEPLVVTVDHFSFVPEARAAIEERLTIVGERDESPGRDGTSVFAVVRDGGRRKRIPGGVLVGRLEVGEGTLRVETNSLARADALRGEVEAACGDPVRHRLREHTDPRAAMRRGPSRGHGAGVVDTPEAGQLVLEFKRRHYAAWLDEPIPALGDLTPREAVHRPASRRQLELLLQDMEQAEARGPAGQGVDFGWVRGELGLER